MTSLSIGSLYTLAKVAENRNLVWSLQRANEHAKTIHNVNLLDSAGKLRTFDEVDKELQLQ